MCVSVERLDGHSDILRGVTVKRQRLEGQHVCFAVLVH
jgi:hypothetical protein